MYSVLPIASRVQCRLLLLSVLLTAIAAHAQAQQPWRVINRAAKKYDKAVRDAVRTQEQFSKRIYRQQEKLNRQNEQAIRKYYRTGNPNTVIMSYEPVPVLAYPTQSVVTPVPFPVISTIRPAVTYPSAIPAPVIQGPVVVEHPAPVNVTSSVVASEWTTVEAPTPVMVSSGKVVYERSQSLAPEVESEFAVQPASARMSVRTPTPTEPMPTGAEPIPTPAAVDDDRHSEPSEPTLAPIPDPVP